MKRMLIKALASAVGFGFPVFACGETLDEWHFVVKEDYSQGAVEGVGVTLRARFYDNAAPAIELGACKTNSAGECSITVKGDFPYFTGDGEPAFAALTATKAGFEAFERAMRPAPVVDGRRSVAISLSHISPILFTVKDTAGAGLGGVKIVYADKKVLCVTTAKGSCVASYGDDLFFVEAEKSGYKTEVIASSVKVGGEYFGVLTSDKEIKEEERKRKEQEAAEKAKRQAGLRSFNSLELCEAYGRVVRKESLSEKTSLNDADADIVDQEFKRRKLAVNRKLVERQVIRVGITTCELYASWGYPGKVNRSVGRWGEHVQHVYFSGESYVYTENGRVTSWQD